MRSPPIEEIQLIERYRLLNQEERQMILGLVKDLTKHLVTQYQDQPNVVPLRRVD